MENLYYKTSKIDPILSTTIFQGSIKQLKIIALLMIP